MNWESLEKRLQGGHPNSLGNTVEVVEDVLVQPECLEALFQCYQSEDEVVRLRVSNAMKRIAKAQASLLNPYLDRFLNEVALLDQASAQWTFAQLFLMLEKELSSEQKQKAQSHIQNNLENHQDWIVLNTSMETLAHWAKKDAALKLWLEPHLERLSQDKRKSVANRAQKYLLKLYK